MNVDILKAMAIELGCQDVFINTYGKSEKHWEVFYMVQLKHNSKRTRVRFDPLNNPSQLLEIMQWILSKCLDIQFCDLATGYVQICVTGFYDTEEFICEGKDIPTAVMAALTKIMEAKR